jgi:hypothetical protein
MPRAPGLMLILLAVCACKSPLSPGLDDLRSAPQAIVISGRAYTLETYLYRDFMPVSPPDGRPLTAIIRVSAEDRKPFPAALDADRIYVINGGDIWEAILPAESGSGDPSRQHQLEKVARDGPKWGPGIYVDVVVRIVESGGKDHLLRASNQYIARTD